MPKKNSKLKIHPSSLIPHPSSSIPHPSSSIPHPSSSIPHPSSSIPHPSSSIPHPSSFILLLLVFVPRLLDLDVFLTADEPLFLDHARNFARGLAGGDFGQTLGIGYPGVTVAWWSAAVVGRAAAELGAYVAGRFVTALVTGLLLLGLYALSRRLLGRWPALLSAGLLALDPYTLAYSRLLHIEAPLALLMTLAGVSFLRWLHRPAYRWLWLGGLFAGLALLTKSTALLLGPMLGLGLLGWGLVAGRFRHGRWWLRQAGAVLLIALVAGAVFFVLWPAMWVDPADALNLTFAKLLTDQEAGAGNLGMFWLGRFVEDPGPAFYPLAFLLKATPWLLLGLCLSLYSLLCSLFATRHPKPETRNNLFLWLFALAYLLLMTSASKKSIRYMLPAFPVFYLLAGQSLSHFGEWVNRRVGEWANGRIDSWSMAPANLLRSPLSALRPIWPYLLSLSLALFTLLYHPYYFTYYNPLLLGWRWAPQTLLVGWGEGLDEAARYLNAQPQRRVATWYEWLFPLFYHGPVEPVTPPENLLTAGHAVLYINQVQRDIPDPNLIHYFRARRRPEYTVRLAGIDYAWVYPGPVIGFGPDPEPRFPLSGDYGGELRLLGYELHPR
ncbi:MAG: glycosyltransferase family 39 protein, partial [Chloroflexota bacterium]